MAAAEIRLKRSAVDELGALAVLHDAAAERGFHACPEERVRILHLSRHGRSTRGKRGGKNSEAPASIIHRGSANTNNGSDF